jgi:hypothetical protein
MPLVGLVDLRVGDLVEAVGAADGVDVVVGLGAELILDLAPDIVGSP